VQKKRAAIILSRFNRISSRGLLAALLFLFLLPARSNISADVIIMKNGERFRGIIRKEDEKRLQLEVSFGEITFAKSEILEIQRESRREGLVSLSESYLKENKFDQAIKRLKELLQTSDSAEADNVKAKLIEVYLLKIEYLEAHRRPLEAWAETENALAIEPSDKKLRELRLRLKSRLAALDEGVKEGQIQYDLGNFKESVKILSPLYRDEPTLKEKIAPVLAGSFAALGKVYFKDRAFGQALECFERALAVQPEIIDKVKNGWLYCKLSNIIDRLNEEGEDISPEQLESIEKELEEMARYAPESIHLHYALGIVYQRLEKRNQAFEQYALVTNGKGPAPESVDELDAVRQKAEEIVQNTPMTFKYSPQQTLEAASDAGPWQTLEGSHFIVYHHNAEIGRRALAIAEYFTKNALVELVGEPLQFSRKCAIYIFRNEQEYSKASGRPPWTTGHTFFKKTPGKPVIHEIYTYQTARDLLRAVIPHETTHAITNEALGFEAGVPLWFKEGIAVLQEPEYNRNHLCDKIRTARTLGTFIPLQELLATEEYPDSKEKNALFYAESMTLVELIIKKSPETAPLKFARSLASEGLPEALKKTYGLNMSALKELWEKRIDEISKSKSPF